jgi:serine/threonine-protein kinase
VPLVKVLDFGLSKAIESVSDDASFRYSTEAMRIMGSARYMSPEQATGSPDVDHRTDIWSIGAVLYELVAGVPAFAAPTRSESLAKVLAQEPPPLSSVRPDVDVPPELEATISRCLQKPADLRFASIQDLVEALAPHAPRWAMSNVARVRASRGLSVAPDVGFDAAARALRASEMTTRLARPSRPRWRLRLLVASVAVVALAGGIRRLIPPGRAAATGAVPSAPPVAATAPAPAPVVVVSASVVAPVAEPAADQRFAPAPVSGSGTRTSSPTTPPAPRRPATLRARARRSEPAVRAGAPVGNVRNAAPPPPIDPLEGRR